MCIGFGHCAKKNFLTLRYKNDINWYYLEITPAEFCIAKYQIVIFRYVCFIPVLAIKIWYDIYQYRFCNFKNWYDIFDFYIAYVFHLAHAWFNFFQPSPSIEIRLSLWVQELTRKEQKSFMVRAKVLFIKLPKLQCSIKICQIAYMHAVWVQQFQPKIEVRKNEEI